ncbi:cyclopropane-fatty-acyl-phospholipid synthase family protein [Silanimonas sp.]|jgi:cyclopropane-fatty-acyl-phospholipid synthase|uniref:SAM-dependent methyltransferase n=1 Tax=Silanimonas sp. TaxID=1929290 RepID=UPI0022BCC8AD|nr:cyclopropane-fatty-acyl-phospholipid synthase family protein [Silanimonas sp.]MCZ8164679.1 cyclopropane-fatty-acyl-phospholipid synthase [Silanimonas sp.]
MALIDLCERGLVPDFLTRYGIRKLCEQRLRDEHDGDLDRADARFRTLLSELRSSPIAIETAAANEQHYEVPTRFFELSLGKRLKYSGCYYPDGNETLDEAEEKMLALYGERAELKDGMRILELGCGWGSLTLWMAERFPNSRITGVSNSRTQREHILAQAAVRGLANVEIITTDVNRLDLSPETFDRCVSIEMFEHMRNYDTLLGNIARWLKPGGKLFVHIFCHRSLMYPFETEGSDNWMGRYFFTGGLMPSADTLLHFQSALRIEQRWVLSGIHYEKTANHWLENQDRHAEEVHRVLAETYGAKNAAVWAQRWRMFWMACAELFGYAGGSEWGVAHYRFVKR